MRVTNRVAINIALRAVVFGSCVGLPVVALGTGQSFIPVNFPPQLHDQPESGHARTDARDYLVRAVAKLKERDFDGAMADSDRVILLAPNSPVAYCVRGECKHEKHLLDAALEDFDPGFVEYVLAKGELAGL